MDATATLSQYRQAPRKVRLLADLLKGLTVESALVEMRHRAKRAAPVFEKLINSAVANAIAKGMDKKTLIVQNITVDKGPVLKRSMPRAQGRAFPIHKHTSHIVVTITDAPRGNAIQKMKKTGKKSDTKAADAATSEAKPAVKKAVTKKPAAKATK